MNGFSRGARLKGISREIVPKSTFLGGGAIGNFQIYLLGGGAIVNFKIYLFGGGAIENFKIYLFGAELS